MPASVPNPIAASLARVAAATPEVVAVRDHTTALTYAELADEVARTAGAVTEAVGGATDLVVPVLVGRGAGAAADVLAVQHAGFTVAPIDTSLPPEALGDLWRRAGSPPVVVGRDASLVEALSGVTVIAPGTGDPVPAAPVRSDALATVLFTSGSTGAPKGVMYDWQLVAGAVTRWDDPILSGPPGAVAGLLFPFHFWGGFQRLLSLVTGRPLVVVDPTAVDADGILDRLDDGGVEVTGLIPAMIPVLAGAARAGGRRLERIRLVTLGGESVSWHHVGLVRSFVATDAWISVGYGGTEAPLGSLRLDIPPDRPLGTGPTPLGHPVAPDRVRFEPVGDEPDAPHQIVVTGPVALGYLGDPEQTARAFPVRPDGTRYWQTGDVAEPDTDGELFYVGRVDDLVKINGKLVAPAQTQGALLTVSGVREAAVLAQEVGGRPRLVAHVVVDDATRPGDVRAALRAALPAHQLPHHLVRHERLPLTASTKVDRRALTGVPPSPWRDHPPVGARNLVEQNVVQDVIAILGIHVGVDDDLWDFGLDSLGALELAAALQDDGWTVDPNLFLDCATPAAIAAHLASGAGPRDSAAVTMNDGGTRPAVWCIPGAGAPALSFRSLADALGPDQPVVVVEPRGYRSPGRPPLTIGSEARAVVARVQADRPAGRVVVAAHSLGVPVAYEACRVLADEGWRPHLVALDAAPLTRRTTPPGLGVRARLRRRVALARDAVVGTWRWLVPDPRPNRLRYDLHFANYRLWAAHRYRPRPATFPTLLVRVEGSSAESRWPAPPDRVVTVTGTHGSMMQPPNVAQVADHVRAVVDAAVDDDSVSP